jgi:hypothetical protein
MSVLFKLSNMWLPVYSVGFHAEIAINNLSSQASRMHTIQKQAVALTKVNK